MNDSTPIETQLQARPRTGRLPLALAFAGLLAACGGGGGVGGSLDSASPGQSSTKPGASDPFNGGSYIVDPNNAGTAQSFELIEMEWGRLVDVLDTGPNGEPRLIFNDFLVGEEVRDRSEGGVLIWDFETNPVTGESSLQINVDIQADPDLFDFRIFEATAGLTPVPAKGLGNLGVPPFPLVARNSTLSLRFNDLIDENSISLNETVQILVGSPPTTPFDARLIPDSNRGGIGAEDGQFHSTRLLVDFTITESELQSITEVVELNGLGLPPSPDLLNANVGIRIPTTLAPPEGVFSLFTNLRGESLDPGVNDPVDLTSSSNDVVRGMRSGNPEDPNNGFLVDLDRPQVVGVQPVTIVSAEPELSTPNDPRDFRVSFSYAVPACAIDPTVGDQVQLADFSLAIDASGTVVGSTANNILVRSPANLPPPTATSFLGQSGQFQTAWRDSLNPNLAPCFVRFTPSAGLLPVTEVDPASSVVLRFSEPLDPASVRPFDTMYIGKTSIVDAGQTEGPTAPQPADLVVGDVIASPDFTEFRFSPLVPFNHVGGTSESYFLNLISSVDSGIVDLAGNGLLTVLPRVEFRMDPNEPSEDTGGWVFRFNAVNEDSNAGPEVRGQVLFDLINGELDPRMPQRFGAILDRTQPMVGAMQAIPTGLQTPLASAGSRAHLTWRYTDVGYSISQTDGNLYDLDVEGISLSPLGGTLTNTAYPEFEIQLGHGARVPDERVGDGNLLPDYPNSGFEPNNPFIENFLGDPADGPQVVYPRENGFVVSSSDIFQSTTLTPMLPMPWNRGLPEDEKTFFTWRNTAITTLGNLNQSSQLVGAGVPLDQEVLILGLTQEPGSVYGGGGSGSTGVDFPAGVPTVGLPLITEFRCYPSDAPSVNNFDVSIAVTSSNRPFFRAFSTGGVNQGGNLVEKDPDEETSPSGGFNGNPQLGALGQSTNARDPTVYIGQLDIVLRLSRAHTILVDAEQSYSSATLPGVAYDYVTPLLEPNASEQPLGTSIVLAFRGDDFGSEPMEDQFVGAGDPGEDIVDASRLDVYGNVAYGSLPDQNPANIDPAVYALSNPEWVDSVDGIDGLRYTQTRFTFVSNTAAMTSPTLSSFAMAFRR